MFEGRRRNQWGEKDWAGEEDSEPGRNRTQAWPEGEPALAANKDKRVIASGVRESSVNTHRLPCVLDTPPKPRPPSHPLVEISDPESELKEPRGANPLPLHPPPVLL